MSRIYIEKGTQIERFDLYRVKATLPDGSIFSPLEARSLFPLSDPDHYVSLLNDEKEVAIIRDLAELDESSAKAVKDCLAEYYLIPQIKRVYSIKDQYGTLVWTCETDRGKVTFRIKDRHNDIKFFHQTNRLLVRDSNDNRYEIPDTEALDAKTHHLLFPYI